MKKLALSVFLFCIFLGINAHAQSFRPKHKVVFEDQTICSGGFGIYCPRGIVAFSAFSKGSTFDKTEIISVHSTYSTPADGMGNAAYYNGCFYSPNGAWVHTNAWPQVMVDRKATTPPDSLDDYFATYTDDAGLADIDITPVYNPGTRMLDVKAKVHFALDVPSSLAHLNLALVLTENDVHGTTINFSQRNKYSGGLSGPMASDEMDFAAQDDPVPADSMYYQHVARVISPSYKGKEGSLPTIIQADSIYSYTFPSYKIPAAYIPAKMRAIVLLIDTISGNIKNANGVNLSTVISGVHGASDPAGTFTLSPNPFNRETELRFSLKRSEQVSLKVLDVLGKVVSSRKLGNLQSGVNSIQLSCAELTTGVYFVTITTEHESLTERVVVSR